jgi:hypothetical protein
MVQLVCPVVRPLTTQLSHGYGDLTVCKQCRGWPQNTEAPSAVGVARPDLEWGLPCKIDPLGHRGERRER